VEPLAGDYGAVLADAERVLDGVDRALERLDDGTYGVCAVCGEAIADDRLAETPLARNCERHLPVAEPSP